MLTFDLNQPALSTVALTGSRLENNSEAAITLFGADLVMSGSSLECNSVDVVGYESYLGQSGPVSFQDGGANRCGCLGGTQGCAVSNR